MFRKIMLSFIAISAVLFAGISVSADTSGDYTYTINVDGTATITWYKGPGGDLVIPDTLNGYKVTVLGDGSFNSKGLTSIVLPNTLEEIKSHVFLGNSITSMVLPDSVHTVTSGSLGALKHLYVGATYTGEPRSLSNSVIETIAVSPENPYYKDINQKGFYSKDGAILYFGTTAGEIAPGVSTIGSAAFSGKKFLTDSIIIPEGVTTLGDSVFSSSNLRSISFPSTLTTVGAQIIGQTPISTVRISSGSYVFDPYLFDGLSITSYEVDSNNTVYQDINGTGLYSKDGTTLIRGTRSGIIEEGTITIADSAFYGTGVSSVNISSTVQTIEAYAFGENPNLTTVTIPESVTETMESAFAWNDSLETVNVLNATMTFGPGVFEDPSLGFVLNGYEGSTTESYATANGHTFEIYSALSSGSGVSIPSMVRVLPGALTFANELVSVYADKVTLNGQNQTVTALFSDTMDIIDARGNHAGYDVQVSFTDFISGENTITKENITLKNLQTASIDGVNGPTENVSAASAFSLINLGVSKGIGQHTMDFSNVEMDVFISDKTIAGIYNGTMTFSLVTSP